MHRAPLPARIAAFALALVLFVLTAGATLALADDYRSREVLPVGATVAGVDVSGLTRAQAVDLVSQQVADPLAAPLKITADGRAFTFDAGDAITVDVVGMVESAFAPRAVSALMPRVADRLLDRPRGASAEMTLTVDAVRVAEWVDEMASAVDTAAVDATVTVEVNKLMVEPSREGRVIDRAAAAAALHAALVAGSKDMTLPVTYHKPTVTEMDLGPAIIVDLSERRLYLYRNGDLEKKYGVAVGTPSHPTPRGDFKIVLKRYMPTWSNPGSAWAEGMPKTIAPGPSNPLGTRALNINSPGIRIHGTSADSSIGTAASHGCMRMHRWDIEDLYERVEVGTPVFIVR